MAYAVVYKEDGEWLIYQNKNGAAAVFFNMKSAVSYLNSVFEKIDYKLDGSPTRYCYIFSTYIKRIPVSEENRKSLKNKKSTSCIKKIDSLRFDDDTALKGSK